MRLKSGLVWDFFVHSTANLETNAKHLVDMGMRLLMQGARPEIIRGKTK